MIHLPRWFVAVAALAAILLCACGSSAGAKQRVLIEPLETATPQSEAAAAAASPRAEPAEATATVAAPASDAAPTATAATEPSSAATADDGERPTEGRWIEVDVTNFVVRLMDGNGVVRTIEPVAVGEQVNTGAYESTQTGLFHVYNKAPELAYDAPYKTYISDWVGFDPAKDNGFHSFLKDKDGNVVDASTGRISNGCIRTGDAAAITAFAEIGMPVWVHA